MRLTDDDIRAAIYRSCLALDEEDFAAYMALCGAGMLYRIVTYSPEIRKDVILMSLDREGLASLFESLPDHIKLPGRLMRHASVYLVSRNRNGTAAEATTSVTIVRTGPDGLTQVFAAGRYHDTLDLTGPAPVIATRTLQLETRDIGIGVEVPL